MEKVFSGGNGIKDMNSNTGYFATINKTSKDVFNAQLSNYVFVDIGNIIDCHDTGMGIFATVRSGRLLDGAPVTYSNVEVLCPGSRSGGVSFIPAGDDPCLCFCPKTPLLSTATGQVSNLTARSYDPTTMKAIPIASPSGWHNQFGVDATGSIVLGTPFQQLSMHGKNLEYGQGEAVSLEINELGYVHLAFTNLKVHYDLVTKRYILMQFDDDQKVLYLKERKADGTTTERWSYKEVMTPEEDADPMAYELWLKQLETLVDGTITTTKKDADGNVLALFVRTPDGGTHYTLTDADGNVLVDRVTTPDGGCTYVHKNTDGDELLNLAAPADGSVALQMAKGNIDLAISPEGEVTLTNAEALTATISKAVTLTLEDALTVAVSGAVTHTFEDAFNLEVTSDLLLKSSAGITIESPATVLTGGTVDIAGTVAPTGSGALCGIPACLFTGAPHVGPQASGA